jgi:hypothetical protein
MSSNRRSSAANGFQPHQFTGHRETGDLVPRSTRPAGLEETAAQRVQAAQWLAGAVQRVTGRNAAMLANQAIEAHLAARIQPGGQTQATGVAVAALAFHDRQGTAWGRNWGHA